MKVAFAGAFALRLAEPVMDRLSIPADLVTGEEAEIVAGLSDVEVLVSMGFSAAMAEAAPRLRLVQVPGAGLDRVDLACLGPGTAVANVYGHEAGIAEYVIGAMIALGRGFRRLDARLREGRWESQFAVGVEPPPLWPELAGKTLGILGFGHIGQALARRAAALEMRVCAIRRRPEADAPPDLAFLGGPERLDELMALADVLAITLPLSAATRGLVDARRLALMKPSALLVNVARAEIVDQTALFQALESRRIAGAALDFWYRYPASAAPTRPGDAPFHELDNVLMTPHVSGWTEGMFTARAALIAGNIERTARGEPPLNLIDGTG